MLQRFSRLVHRRSYLNHTKLHRRFFSSEQLDVAVIGGGPGGYACAIKAAQLGLSAICIEGRGTLGGTCLNVGCIPSKALLHNSHLYHEAKHDFAKRGIIIDNVKLDLKALMGIKSQSVDGLTKGIEGLFKKNKVKYTKGWGKLVGANQIEVNTLDNKTETISAKNIVIATGSDSAKIPGIDIDEKDIVSSTGALSFDAVPESLLVVGAGVIGLELGSVWNRLGSKVHVVEFLDRILPGVDQDYASKFQKMLTKQGMSFQLSHAVKGIEKQSSGKLKVSVENNADKKISTAEYEKVLVAIGRVPYTEGLGLENVGIQMNEQNKRQVAVNDHFQTNVSNIYAIGDVIRGAMLAHKAEEEGIACAEIIAGKPGHVNYNAIPGVIYTYPEVASVGKTEEELKQEGVEYVKGEFPFLANSRARTNADAEGFVKILADKKTDRMLGVHIIGPNAGEMIAEGVIALEYGASAEDIARTCHAHPTLSEAFKEACMNACGMKAIHF
eukprot:CAMPEP_0197021030 /NCGR_PEP_ID=MMETSP1384-20130603/1926_1 /TAXON_ID=29189 /ORGANISM="Ammonia sp." /LENGTH=497 /DNA_ID=CAMNT_0042448777 /DNA_START=32 /DNA_END=1525 /DNA_ORIENTATION=+